MSLPRSTLIVLAEIQNDVKNVAKKCKTPHDVEVRLLLPRSGTAHTRLSVVPLLAPLH